MDRMEKAKLWLLFTLLKKTKEMRSVSLTQTQNKLSKLSRSTKKIKKICDLAVTFDNRKIICGGSTTKNIIVIDVESEVIKIIQTTHKREPTWC